VDSLQGEKDPKDFPPAAADTLYSLPSGEQSVDTRRVLHRPALASDTSLSERQRKGLRSLVHWPSEARPKTPACHPSCGSEERLPRPRAEPLASPEPFHYCHLTERTTFGTTTARGRIPSSKNNRKNRHRPTPRLSHASLRGSFGRSCGRESNPISNCKETPTRPKGR
jgi:hypothetical protein